MKIILIVPDVPKELKKYISRLEYYNKIYIEYYNKIYMELKNATSSNQNKQTPQTIPHCKSLYPEFQVCFCVIKCNYGLDIKEFCTVS